jgi:hypothetical protein
MLDAFDAFARQLCAQGERAAELERLVNIVIEENRLAVLWRHLMDVGVAFPKSLWIKSGIGIGFGYGTTSLPQRFDR